MKLQQIDKARYRKHLNRVIAAVIITLVVVSLVTSTTLISFFGVDDGSNFRFNLAGVVSAVLVVLLILRVVRYEPYLYEVMYVWQLKKSINLINRYLRKVASAAEQGDADAMQALNYSYMASRQLYTLDDNTINMEELDAAITVLNRQADAAGVVLDVECYHPDLLTAFK
ncbi:hypothetical protein SIN8267_00625 [Sinobacterium norvegicum]|uniref:DUF3087 domain-containing protein n=2 Tax=Sinobacterium norvegicum TaxID=1641715 RepID=A0ABN8EFV1_9GAMM|nr:hypothetical protein SIN8267_00625 [Sinobacterium norvegicum]